MPRGDFAVVTHPDKQPACDFLTRSTTGPFIDTGVDVILRSRPGDPLRTERVYLAKDTITNLAQLLDISGNGTSVADEGRLRAEGAIDLINEGLGDDIRRLASALTRIVRAADGGAADLGGTEAL